eukprot:TRINITY_DN1577_c0_g3_i2.p1 TRINITY_DN1577_c0_g3~~TRINITY_DN1577_c0_g3_i2.p1  ORF type:complete len:345 (+),score=60.74 TRINITY_DN1577_c0_g3_i2:117-1151(+)
MFQPILFYLIALSYILSPIYCTSVSINGTDWYLDGKVTYQNSKAQGLLLNARLIQAAFDDVNASTVHNWYYPDTNRWDPLRNTEEFIGNLSTFYNYGLRLFTVGMQGGAPIGGGPNQPWIVTAFNPDGSLKPDWLSRLDSIIRKADSIGFVVILQYFYVGQDERILTDHDVVNAVDAATDWVLKQGYTNVMIEVANECNIDSYVHENLKPPGIPILIKRVQDRSGGKLLVSTSFLPGVPTGPVLSQSDFILIHGNHLTPSGITSLVKKIKETPEYLAKPKPIVFNEDSTNILNCVAAVESGASWGYHDKGITDYHDGFQAPPVDWSISTKEKQAFFNLVAQLTR